jgi:superfamily II DNA helicase RecQ
MGFSTQYKTFFVSPFGEATVCDELNKFLKSNRIINVEKSLIDGERGTGWLFLIEYGADIRPTAGGSQHIDYREILSEQDYALFDKLRGLRKEVAEKQGLPVYAVFTNDQLAAMIKSKASTLKDLAAVPGIGESRIKQYGGQFLGLLGNNIPQGTANETPKPPV